MTNMFMEGPFDLRNEVIDKHVTKMSIGVYLLGEIINKNFVVHFVGRSNVDLNQSLKDCVGKFEKFKFEYLSSEKEAFEKECKNYHNNGENEKLENKNHPEKPYGSDWQCPNCSFFYKI